MELVEVRPLKPFIGSYRCPLADADVVDEMLVELDSGVITKQQVPRKKFVGLISTQRRLSGQEVERFLAGQLPSEFEVLNGTEVLERHRLKPQSPGSIELLAIVHPVERTVRLPINLAEDLVSRGLAEAVTTSKKRGRD